MANSKSNFPPAEVARLDGSFIGDTVRDLQKISSNTNRPATVEELRERIGDYFEFCQNNCKRPGIEALCLALGITRQTLHDWIKGLGKGKNREWQETCIRAKQLIIAFLEEVNLSGKINPVSGIFLLKTWAGYKEVTQYEISQGSGSAEHDDLPSIEEIGAYLPNYDDDTKIISRTKLDI